jgi:hypothetical protein
MMVPEHGGVIPLKALLGALAFVVIAVLALAVVCAGGSAQFI